MKKLIVALTISFMFIAGSAFAATWSGTLYGGTIIADFTAGLIAPIPQTNFTFEMDGDSMVTSSVTVTWTAMGEEGPETVTSYTRSTNMDWDMAGIIPESTITYPYGPPPDFQLTVIIDADSTDEGLNMNINRHFYYDGSGDYYDGSNWGKTSSPTQVEPRQSLVDCHVNGAAYSLAVYGISVNAAATTATHMEGLFWLSQAFDGAVDASGAYKWEADLAVPIPAAAWLLLSGLVGIVGLRRKS